MSGCLDVSNYEREMMTVGWRTLNLTVASPVLSRSVISHLNVPYIYIYIMVASPLLFPNVVFHLTM